MKRITYDFPAFGKHCWQVDGADNMPCDEVCAEQDDGCENCPISRAFERLVAIENILGDDYVLDRLRELVQADRDGRCVVLPAGGYSNEDGERALKNAMFVVGLTNNGVNRYIADAIAEKLTREAAESTP